jgi:hypothetical protein
VHTLVGYVRAGWVFLFFSFSFPFSLISINADPKELEKSLEEKNFR